MITEPTCLEVHDLQVSFSNGDDRITVLHGVSFALQRGRTLALVGESGCGKSATAHALLRLVQKPGRIDGGRILLHPRGEAPIDVLALPPGASDLYRMRGGIIAMVFQEPQAALSPVHTIGAQLCEALRLHQKLSRLQAETQVIDMLAELGMPHPAACMSQYPHELSGGMRQRAVIAMALVCQPQVLVADEPTTALDEELRLQVLRLFNRLQAQHGTAVLLITHDLAAVARHADDIAVMYCGRIVEHGPAHEVMVTPRHPYTRALMDTFPKDVPRSSQRRLATIAGSVPELGMLPQGCRFHPRCSDAQNDLCNTPSVPNLRNVSPGHGVACFKVLEMLHG